MIRTADLEPEPEPASSRRATGPRSMTCLRGDAAAPVRDIPSSRFSEQPSAPTTHSRTQTSAEAASADVQISAVTSPTSSAGAGSGSLV